MFHICCISIHKLLYFSLFSASFCTFLSAGTATSIRVYDYSFLFSTVISGLLAVTSLNVCTPWFHNTGLFKMIVGVLTTCHKQYAWDRSV
jgi:hypothetical protein